MSALISVFVVLHMLCWAVALGIWVAAVRTREPAKGLSHAALGALAFGIVLAALVSIAGDANHMKLGIKLVVAIIAAVFAVIAQRKGRQTSAAVWYGVPVAIVVNVIVAVFV
jgi:peptidoglycan/LPS O-acetylase OafA/YrhL